VKGKTGVIYNSDSKFLTEKVVHILSNFISILESYRHVLLFSGYFTSRKKGFHFELLGALAPVVLRTQTKGCISTGS
jgi:hypothetical protein